ncbi:MAG TPA: polymorphic toxin type 50 domain-containing protein [Chlamydiales bacterium]|nr:polymorphic toxin type 50 domain-containing protein [Chlamydiales bacterium]
MGASKGSVESMRDYIPSLLASPFGLANHLWAAITHPIQTSVELTRASIAFINFIREADLSKVGDLVPELKALCKDWDKLNPLERGSAAGYVFTKYGTEILLPVGIAKGVKVYHELRRAEKIMALETLAASPAHKKELIELSTRWAEVRKEAFAHYRIEMDKQGKHILGHRNYDPSDIKSIFFHPSPNILLDKHAGTGRKKHGSGGWGEPGYKELVDFGEPIGYHVNIKTGEKTLTTKGTIHYSKKGAHIVPAHPTE